MKLDDSIESLIEKKCKLLNLDEALVKAIVITESGGNQWLNRYEPNWKYCTDAQGWASRLSIAGMMTTVETEIMNQSTSWGLMQIMGTVAREMGFNGPLPQLADRVTGLHFGCLKLKKLLDRWGSVELALDAYNSGDPHNGPGKDYVKKVLSNYKN